MTSFFIYIIGLISLYVSDLYISTYFGEDVIAQWAEVRSLIGLSGIISLLGMEMVLVRNPLDSDRIFRLICLQLPATCFVVGYIIYKIGFMSSIAEAFLLTLGSSLTILVYQYYRTHNEYTLSQLFQQLWKVFVLLTLIILVFYEKYVDVKTTVIAFILIISMIGLVSILNGGANSLSNGRSSYKKLLPMYSIGIRFVMTSSLLALSIYAEQLIVKSLSGSVGSATYFSHATYFLFPMSIMNGYLGFLIGPWIRDNKEKFYYYSKQYRIGAFIFVLIAALSVNLMGGFLWSFLVNPDIGINTNLRVVFLMTSIVTSFYQIPSGYNGIYALKEHQNMIIIYQISSVILALLTFVLLFYKFDLDILISVAISSFMNWVGRTASGYFMIYKIKNTYE
jgi:hypothetical protein